MHFLQTNNQRSDHLIADRHFLQGCKGGFPKQAIPLRSGAIYRDSRRIASRLAAERQVDEQFA